MSKRVAVIFIIVLALIIGGIYWAASGSPAVAPTEPNPVDATTGSSDTVLQWHM